MRVVVCALLLLLGACGQNAEKAKAPDAPSAATVELDIVLNIGRGC